MNIHSFKFKISVILMLCTLLPLAAATQLLSFYAEKNTITQAKEDIALSMEAQIQNMENVLKSVEDMQQDMKNDALIYEFANQTRIMSNEIRQNYCRKVFQQLKYYQDRIAAVKVTNEVHSAYVYLPCLLYTSDAADDTT